MRRYSLPGTLAVVALVSCVVCWAAADADPEPKRTATTAPVPAAAAAGKATAKASPPVSATASAKVSPRASSAKKPAAESPARELSAAVSGVIRADGGHAAVAVDNLSTGAEASFNGSGRFATASIVKVDILSALLYRLRESGQTISDEQGELATTMIENSDNDAASDLYSDDGEAAGLDAANKAFGLTGTTAGPDGEWGLTSTTVTDQITILRQVFTGDSRLPASSRDYIQDLMSQVETDQRWGVSAAADSGGYLVKNGWLPNPVLWEINSIGEVTHDGQKLLVAVLSSDNETEDGGIDLVEQVAKKAADAMTRRPR